MCERGSLLRPVLTRVKNPLPIGTAQFFEPHPEAIAVLVFEHHDIAVTFDERCLDGRACRGLLLA